MSAPRCRSCSIAWCSGSSSWAPMTCSSCEPLYCTSGMLHAPDNDRRVAVECSSAWRLGVRWVVCACLAGVKSGLEVIVDRDSCDNCTMQPDVLLNLPAQRRRTSSEFSLHNQAQLSSRRAIMHACPACSTRTCQNVLSDLKLQDSHGSVELSRGHAAAALAQLSVHEPTSGSARLASPQVGRRTSSGSSCTCTRAQT